MSDSRESLEELRREIDRIDDQMHDLIIRRAEMAQRVRQVKGDGPAFRPAREAQLLRRLIQIGRETHVKKPYDYAYRRPPIALPLDNTDLLLQNYTLRQMRVEQIARSQRHRFPRNAPPAVSLLCDFRGQVWLQQFSTADHPLGYGREWIVVDPRGASRRVRFPPGFQPRAFTRAAAVGVRTDSLDVQQIATVPL